MATKYQNLSGYNPDTVPDGTNMKIGIVVSEWNTEITETLLNAAYHTLTKHGVKDENIIIKCVPGSFELVFGAKHMMDTCENLDAIIVLGCVIRGGTPHFEYVCSGVTQGITELNAKGFIPISFGLLTTDNMQQALDRAGGKYGNKGDEAAITALKMIDFSLQKK